MTLSKGGRSGLWIAAADLAEQPAPLGAPSNVHWTFDVKWRFNWTNYAAYQTQVSKDGGSTVFITLAAGVIQYGAESSSDPDWRVRHWSGGVGSAWVGVGV